MSREGIMGALAAMDIAAEDWMQPPLDPPTFAERWGVSGLTPPPAWAQSLHRIGTSSNPEGD